MIMLTDEERSNRRLAGRIKRDGPSHRTTKVPVRHDLVAHLLQQGPMENESQITFRCRVAWLREGRRLWLDAWAAGAGVAARACRILGISDTNARRSLRQFGLSRELLNQAIAEKIAID